MAGPYFWVGSSGNTSDATNHWATVSGGPPNVANVPTSADNVIFDGNSSANAYTVTVDATFNCKDMTWALPGTSGVPTLALSGAPLLHIFGSLTNVATMLRTGNGTVTFESSGSQTITSAGVAFSGNVFFQSSGTYTLQDAMTLSNGTLLTNAGTFNSNAKTITTPNFQSTSGTRTLTLDNSTINITGTSGVPWNINPNSGTLTWSATGSTINFNGGGESVPMSLNLGAQTYGAVNITAAGLISINSSNSFKNLSYTSTTNKTDQLLIGGTQTILASGSLTLAGNSTVNRAFVLSVTLGTQRTITVPNTATVSLTNVDFQDIASAGTFGTWTGTSLGDALGNSGITFDPSVALTYLGGTHNWSDGAAAWSGTTNRTPLPQDDVVLDTTGSAGTLTADMPRLGRNITATNFNKTLSFSVANALYGNIALGASGTYSGGGGTTLSGRGAQTITSAGKTFPTNVAMTAFGGTYTLQDSFATNGATLSLNVGTFTANNFDVSNAVFSMQSGVTVNMGSGTWTLSFASASPWNNAAVATINAGSSTIKFTGNVTTNATFAGGGKTYNNLWWSNTAATGTLIITGANTFNDVKWNRTTARGIQWPAGVTNTIASWTDENLGTAILTVTSSSPGTPATLSKPNGAVSTNYLSLQDSAATGGAAWYAGSHSTNVSGNSGWIFADYFPWNIQAFQDPPPQLYRKRPYLEALMGGQVLGPPPQPIVIPQGGGGAYPHFTHGDGKRKKSVRPIWDKGPAPPAAVETAPEVVARAPDPVPAIPTGPADITGLARLLDPPAPIRRAPPKRKARSRLAETGDTSSGQAVITTLARCSLADHADTGEASVSVTTLGNGLLVDADQVSARGFVDIAGRTAVFDTDIGRATVSTLIRARGEARDDPDTLTAHATWDDDDLALRVLGLVNSND